MTVTAVVVLVTLFASAGTSPGAALDTSPVIAAGAAGSPPSAAVHGSEGRDRAPRGQRATPGADQDVGPVTPLGASVPERLTIAAIGVDVDVMDLGLTPGGTLEVPPGAFPAGWYDGSPTPGELGPAILAGHVSYDGTPGVFERLGEVAVGAEVAVLRQDGTTAIFTVTHTESYAKSAFPTSTVYGDIDHPGLRLITCSGLDASTGTYEDNTVVFAELSGTRGGTGG